jgi:hypothetical protein
LSHITSEPKDDHLPHLRKKPKKITPIKHPKCLHTWGMAHFIDPRERKFHGTWINEGRREGGREEGRDTTKYRNGSFSRWVMNPINHSNHPKS